MCRVCSVRHAPPVLTPCSARVYIFHAWSGPTCFVSCASSAPGHLARIWHWSLLLPRIVARGAELFPVLHSSAGRAAFWTRPRDCVHAGSQNQIILTASMSQMRWTSTTCGAKNKSYAKVPSSRFVLAPSRFRLKGCLRAMDARVIKPCCTRGFLHASAGCCSENGFAGGLQPSLTPTLRFYATLLRIEHLCKVCYEPVNHDPGQGELLWLPQVIQNRGRWAIRYQFSFYRALCVLPIVYCCTSSLVVALPLDLTDIIPLFFFAVQRRLPGRYAPREGGWVSVQEASWASCISNPTVPRAISIPAGNSVASAVTLNTWILWKKGLESPIGLHPRCPGPWPSSPSV